MRRVVAESFYREKIFVGTHTGLEGNDRIEMMTNSGDNWRCKNVNKGKYDGIHFYSKKGQQAMTDSTLAVLRQADLVKSSRAPPSSGQKAPPSSSQWEKVTRGPWSAPAPFDIPLYNRYSGN